MLRFINSGMYADNLQEKKRERRKTLSRIIRPSSHLDKNDDTENEVKYSGKGWRSQKRKHTKHMQIGRKRGIRVAELSIQSVFLGTLKKIAERNDGRERSLDMGKSGEMLYPAYKELARRHEDMTKWGSCAEWQPLAKNAQRRSLPVTRAIDGKRTAGKLAFCERTWGLNEVGG
ncbi:hypothetical protein BDQ17DRAFT_1321982 [Cyathus striatus]|nr:hypothetical protein BDQ17DRAFT_1321982 [Cyathus striatus]